MTESEIATKIADEVERRVNLDPVRIAEGALADLQQSLALARAVHHSAASAATEFSAAVRALPHRAAAGEAVTAADVDAAHAAAAAAQRWSDHRRQIAELLVGPVERAEAHVADVRAAAFAPLLAHAITLRIEAATRADRVREMVRSAVNGTGRDYHAEVAIGLAKIEPDYLFADDLLTRALQGGAKIPNEPYPGDRPAWARTSAAAERAHFGRRPSQQEISDAAA